MWSDWAAGVLQGIGAPRESVNFDTLWAWSSAESGADVMRWNNPLNTTLPWLSPPSHPMNSVGVQAYIDEASGIAATVDTLLNGYYPVIVDHLRRSVPRDQWQDACANLGTWGTGCSWLSVTYGAAPGVLEAIMDQATFDTLVRNNPELGGAGYAARLIYALGITYHAGQPNLETSARIADILNAIKAIPMLTSGAALTPAQAQLLQETHDAILRIEASLKAA